MIGRLPGGVAVVPYGTRPDWERAAALEPVEEILARAGMPPCARWPTVRIDEPGQATLLPPPPAKPTAVLVRTDPPFVLIVPLEGGAPLRITPDGMYGLADGIRITAGRHGDIADGLRLPGGAPLTCEITVTADPQPAPPGESEATGIAVATHPEGQRMGLRILALTARGSSRRGTPHRRS